MSPEVKRGASETVVPECAAAIVVSTPQGPLPTYITT
jgi:hypothetical protein